MTDRVGELEFPGTPILAIAKIPYLSVLEGELATEVRYDEIAKFKWSFGDEALGRQEIEELIEAHPNL